MKTVLIAVIADSTRPNKLVGTVDQMRTANETLITANDRPIINVTALPNIVTTFKVLV